jgi:hypothetical protein
MALATLVAVFALGVVAASAAQAATEGPFYTVAGARLAAGETKEVTVKSGKLFTLRLLHGFEVVCQTMKYAPGAKVIGSTGANAGTGEETIEWSECSVGGVGGEGCQVEGRKLKTFALKSTLGYATSTRSGKILMLFKPASGREVLTFNLTGCSTWGGKKIVTGSFIGEVRSGGHAVEVGSEPAAAVTGEVFVPEASLSIWTESAGALTMTRGGLSLSEATSFVMESKSTLELAGGPLWGVFT